MADLISEGADAYSAAKQVFEADIAAIRGTAAFLIVLDGRVVDEGAAFELGYAFALGKPCYGLQTDTRRAFGTRNNPMIDVALMRIFVTREELEAWARGSSSRYVRRGGAD